MAPSKVLDTHIHLWPSTATQPTNHGWMTPGLFLAKRHGISDYNVVTSSTPTSPAGFVYVETDRFLPSLTPAIASNDTSQESQTKLLKWAREPLEELGFLRRIVESTPKDGDGFSSPDSAKLKGLVIWAPFHLSTHVFTLYLRIAEETLGPEAWAKVVGFRYLLQGKNEDEVKGLVDSKDWIDNLVSLKGGRGGKGWVFDVGVDTHRDGVGMLDIVADMVGKVRKNEGDGKHVRFVLNHLAKPDLSTPNWSSLPTYVKSLTNLASDPHTYMKLSGALNEFAPGPTPSSTIDLLTALHPYLELVFIVFPRRVMFGSDWPVCNVGGPKGEVGNWGFWFEVVREGIEGMEGVDGESVFWGAGMEAYGVEI